MKLKKTGDPDRYRVGLTDYYLVREYIQMGTIIEKLRSTNFYGPLKPKFKKRGWELQHIAGPASRDYDPNDWWPSLKVARAALTKRFG